MDIMKFTKTASFNVLPTHGMKQNKTRKKRKRGWGVKPPFYEMKNGGKNHEVYLQTGKSSISGKPHVQR